MVFLAKLEEKVPATAGIQDGLDILAQRPEFTKALNKEVQERKLAAENVLDCVGHLYAKVGNNTDGNDATWTNAINVRFTEFGDDERAALVVFLNVQSKWLGALDWIYCEMGE